MSGFVVPVIALLHDRGGFPLVLGGAAGFGLLIWGAALAFHVLARGRSAEQPAPEPAPESVVGAVAAE